MPSVDELREAGMSMKEIEEYLEEEERKERDIEAATRYLENMPFEQTNHFMD